MLGKLLKKYPIWILITVLGVTMYSGSLLPKLKIELDFSNYLPSESPELDFYYQYRDLFGSKDDLLTIGIFRQEGIFDSLFLHKLATLTDSCQTLPLVKRATSLTNLSVPRKTLFGIVNLPLIHLNTAGALTGDSIRITTTPLLKDRFISEDGTTTTIVLEISSERDIETSGQLISELDKILPAFEFEETHIAGTMNIEVRFAWLSQQELQLFVLLSLLMIVVVLWVIYRSLTVVFLSLGVFLFSLINLGGLLVLADLKLDILAPMIPSIILIVCLSDSIHVFSRYSLPENSTFTKIEGINEVAKTNFLTSMTTALGFFTLLLSPMPMLYYFGLYVGMGVLIAYIVSILLIPAALFLSNATPKEPQGVFSAENWRPIASHLDHIQQKKGRMIAWVCLALLLISCWGITLIDSNRTIVGPMPQRHSVAQSFHFFEDHMAGARDFEIAITSKEQGGLLAPANLQMVEKLQDYLDSLPEIGGLVSPVSYFKFSNRFSHAGNNDYFILPPSVEALKQLDRSTPISIKREFHSVIDSSRTMGAIRGRIPDMGKNKASALMEQIDIWIAAHLDDSQLTFQHTGTPVILDLVNDVQIEAMFKGLVVAIICISLVMALLFFNWRLVMITLVTNLIPLLIVAGLMGLLGVELRGGTSIVFTIAFVIAVDDTIHFINNVFFRRWKGLSQKEAITQTLQKTGHPIFITSVVILLAFLLLISSDFGNVRDLGILVSLTIVFALLSDLLIAPLLLRKSQDYIMFKKSQYDE